MRFYSPPGKEFRKHRRQLGGPLTLELSGPESHNQFEWKPETSPSPLPVPPPTAARPPPSSVLPPRPRPSSPLPRPSSRPPHTGTELFTHFPSKLKKKDPSSCPSAILGVSFVTRWLFFLHFSGDGAVCRQVSNPLAVSFPSSVPPSLSLGE